MTVEERIRIRKLLGALVKTNPREYWEPLLRGEFPNLSDADIAEVLASAGDTTLE